MANYTVIQFTHNRKRHHYYFPTEEALFSSTSPRLGVQYLKCIENGCHCRAKIVANNFLRSNPTTLHNHGSHQAKAAYERAYEELQKLVRTTRRPIRDLFNEVRVPLSRQARALLVWKRCRRTLQRIRSFRLPPCHSLVELEELLEDETGIVHKTFATLNGEFFYQGTTEDGNMFFANRELIRELSEELEIYIDGTFKITPFHARQLLVVLAELRGRPRPIIYVVMQRQTQDAYEDVFNFIKDAIISYDGTIRIPTAATSDFERAIRQALISVWPGIRHYGCNFHFCQANRRYARSLPNLSPHLTDWTKHHKALVMIMRLSLLPLNRVNAGLVALDNYLREEEIADDFEIFMQYFYHTWMQLFPSDCWCVSDRDRRTNNHLEGYNRAIKQTIVKNPSPWAFLDGLHELAIDATTNFDDDVNNDAPPPPDRSILSEPLNEALYQLEEGHINEIEFLEFMAEPRDN